MYDYWYRFIGRTSAAKVLLVSFAVTGLLPDTVSLLEGNAFTRNEDGGILGTSVNIQHPLFTGDYFVWPIAFNILLPIMFVLSFKFYVNIRNSFECAMKDGIIRFNTASIDILGAKAFVRSRGKIGTVLVVSLALSGMIMAIRMIAHHKLLTWNNGTIFGHSLLFYVSSIIIFVTVFIVANTLVDFFVWIRMLFKLTKNTKEASFLPNLFHPNGSCGLQQFGKTAMSFYWFVLMIGLFILVQLAEKITRVSNAADAAGGAKSACEMWKQSLTRTDMVSCADLIARDFPAVVMTLSAFLVILPAVFFLPMLPLKSMVKRLKTAFLNELSGEMQRLNVEILRNKYSYQIVEEIDTKYQRMMKMSEIYKTVSQTQLWPMKFKSIGTFAISYLATVATSMPQILSLIRNITG